MTTSTYVNLEDAAKHFKVSLSTFRGWVKTGLIPRDAYIRINSIYRFNLDAVEAALKAQSTGD